MKIIRLPGLIDPHVHFRTPGQEYKEDFLTGTSAAVAGGYTTVLDMPNNKTPITTKKLLQEKKKAAESQIVCDIGFHFGSLGDNLSEFEKVKDEVIGLKLYLNETTGNFLIDTNTLYTIYSRWEGGVILVHAEDDAIEQVIKIVEKTQKPTHFCHISLASDLAQIMQARHQGLPITCGITPHHLFLKDLDVEKLGPYGLMKPFLKSQENVDFLWKHLDAIDCIESDHAPHTREEKESETPPFGVPGLETTLPLLLTAVNENRLTIEDVKRLCHQSPARIFGINEKKDTFIEVDLDAEYVITNKDLHTKCSWSPFNGRKVKGKLLKTVIRGTTVFENGKVKIKPGFGKIVT